MNTRESDHGLESFLEDSNKLLEEVDRSHAFVNGAERSSADGIAEEIRHKTMESIGESGGQVVDGSALITVSDDDMEAVADFYPPSPGMEPYSHDQFAELLIRRGVSDGVDWEIIDEALLRCNTDYEPISGVVVARGFPAHDQTPSHFVIDPLVLERAEPDGDGDSAGAEDRRVDHHSRSPFIMVLQGETLAHLAPGAQGTMGRTVRGEAIQYQTARPQLLKPGKHVVLDGSVATAECDGRFQFDGTGFFVNEVLQISGDVDYSTGNVEFAGDVTIQGNIREGFKVQADGAVRCGHTIEASEVECGGDLTVQQGVIGKGKGVVKAGGRFDAKYVENCYVEAKGPMHVEVGMMNAAVHTLDRIDLGYKGVIVGGVTYAQKGITATQLGSQSGAKTEIYCGTDFFVEHQLQWIRDRNMDLATKLSRVNQEVKRSATPRQELLELRDKLSAAIHQMNEAAMNSVNSLDQNEEAQVIVRGRVYPDVYVEICHCSYVVTRTAHNVRFRLDKVTGKVLMEPMGKDGPHEKSSHRR